MARRLPEAWLAIDASKYFIFFFNFLIWSLGAGLAFVAITIRSDGPLWEYVQAIDIIRYYYASYIAIAVGMLLIIFGFVGCLGAAIESPCMLSLYTSVMMICIILEMASCAFVWSPAGGDALQAILSKQIKYHVENRIKDDTSRRFLDLIQLHLECCGAETYVDYRNLNQDIPVSCNSDRTNNVHIRSCGEMLRRKLEIHGALVGGLSVSLILLQVLAILFTTAEYLLLQRNAAASRSRLIK